jgi:hypothetical protein
MHEYDDILALALEAKLRLEDVTAYYSKAKLPPSDVWNSLAIAIAERFLKGQLTFDVADHAINVLNSLMIQDIGESEGAQSLPEPADSIYLAFDRGEYGHHGDGADPVEKYTKPELRKIIGAEPRN